MFNNSPFKNTVSLELREPGHQYIDGRGRFFTSQSAFMKVFMEAFDVEGKSLMTAKSRLRKEGLTMSTENINRVQGIVKAEWSGSGLESTDHGTRTHNSAEHFIKTGERQFPEMDPMYDIIYRDYMKPYYKNFAEQLLYLEDVFLAGTADLISPRTNSTSPIYDIFDFKTNIKKGIEFSSKYRQNMLHAVSHLEQCNYNQYALQLSLYAYMMEVTYGMRIGRLAILFIDKDYQIKEIPVNYMKTEIIMMVDHYMEHELAKQFLMEDNQDPFN